MRDFSDAMASLKSLIGWGWGKPLARTGDSGANRPRCT